MLLSLLSLAQASDEVVSGCKRARSPVHTVEDSIDRETSAPLYTGRYVIVDHDGKVHIHQKIYPNFRGIHREGTQFFACADDISYHNGKYYHSVGDPIIQDEMIGWKIEEIKESDVPFVAQPVEAKLTDDPYEIVPDEECKQNPYFSCGRLNMAFLPKVDGENRGKFRGSAAAIEQNILVTAAHNFIPQVLNGFPNNDRIKADRVSFLHVKTKGETLLAYHVAAAHCFVHPKWEESFDPHYDIAFVFLNQSLIATREEKDKLLSLHVLSPELEHSIQVIGYPLGVEEMRRTNGDVRAREDRPIDTMNIIYHTANTEPGSSGSPLVKDGRSLIGIHTRAPSPGGTMNRGVRVRLDLMPFLNEAVAQNQKCLADTAAYEAEKEAEKAREELQRIEKIEKRGEDRGRADGKTSALEEVAKNLLNDRMSVDDVARNTGLSREQVEKLKH